MFAKSSFLLAAFAAAVQLASAQAPPACLLAAINTNPNPADVKTICGKANAMNDALNSDCGDNVKAAKDAFNAVCKNAGVQVSLSGGPSSSASGNAAYPSSTSTMTYTSHYYDTSCSCTQTATLTTTANVGTGMATATGGSGNQTVATTTGAASGSSATGGSAAGGSSSSGASSTGATAASQTGGASHMVGFSLGAIAMAGLAVAL